MPDYNESNSTKAESGGFVNYQISLTDFLNETYSYQTNSLFYGLIPAYYRTYAWRYIKVACEWIDGYVPRLHGTGQGIPSTRIANRLLTGLVKNIVGERLQFKLLNPEDKSGNETLKFIGQKAKEYDYKKAIYLGIGYSMGLGTALGKLNKTLDGNIWWEAVRFDQCFYSATFRNEVEEATFLVRNYVDTRKNHNNQQYYLCERRFYYTYKKAEILKTIDKDGKVAYQTLHKVGDRVPMVVYCVKCVCGTQSTNTMPSDMTTSSVKWEELPTFMKQNLKRDYSALTLDKPEQLPFKTIGVYPFIHSNSDLGVATAQNFGESLIVPIQDDLMQYELAEAYRIRDMYLGKGMVLLPKSLSMGDLQDRNMQGKIPDIYENNVGLNAIELTRGLDPETQKPIVQQFEVREDVWQKIQDNCIKRIATKWNMTPKIISSYLATTGTAQMTATQIDSEDDVAIAFINYTRSCYTDVIDKMLEETLNFYGKPANVGIGFNSPSLVNKDRLIERTTKKLDAGLIDIDDAVREINPDLEEEALQTQIDKVKTVQEQRSKNEFGQMDFGGSFDGKDNNDDPNQFNADNYDDLGGPNNNGSTNPIQNNK